MLIKTAEYEIESLLIALLKNSPEYQNKIFSIGGFVRDRLLNIESKDLDIVVSELGGAEKFAKYLKGIFKGAISTPYQLGASYPIWFTQFKENIEYNGKIYLTKDGSVDIVETQKECFPDPESRQRITVFGTFDEDIERRDFTINMLAFDLTTESLVDRSGKGIKDLTEKLIRTHPNVNPNKTFSDDPLRMLRAIRFHCKYGFKIECVTAECIKANAKRIEIISGERIYAELVKIMEMGKLAHAVRLMDKLGLLQHILPEVKALQGVEQDIYYHAEGDVYVHTLMVLEKSKSTVIGQMSALCHDLGKPATQSYGEKPDGINPRISFKTHEMVSSQMTEDLMRRLKFDVPTIQRIRKIIEFHLRGQNANEWSNGAVRKFIRDCGEELEDILNLMDADYGSSLGKWAINHIPELRERIKTVSIVPVARKPILNGNELMKLLGLPPGKGVGEAISKLLELEDEFALSNGRAMTKEEAIEKLKEQRAAKIAATPMFHITSSFFF